MPCVKVQVKINIIEQSAIVSRFNETKSGPEMLKLTAKKSSTPHKSTNITVPTPREPIMRAFSTKPTKHKDRAKKTSASKGKSWLKI